ncbi:MFS transporter [Pacificispira spongiicola]|nr:MFS transporter [Pacificispira spongiicola]
MRGLLFLQFLMSLSSLMALPLMAVHMSAHLDLNAFVIGSVFTIHLAFGRALPIVTGPMVDRFGFRGAMVFGLLVRGCGFLLFGSAEASEGVIGSALLIGLGTATYESALYGVFGRQPAAILSRVFVINNFALNLGVVIGPFLGVLLADGDVVVPFRAAGILFVLLGFWSVRFSYLDRCYSSRSAVTKSWLSVIRNRRFLVFLAVTLPWWIVYAQLFVGFPVMAVQITGQESAANLVFITNGATGLIFVAVSLFAFRWISAPAMTTLSYMLLVSAYLMPLLGSGLVWFLAVVFVYTIAETLILPSLETITAALAPDGSQSTYFGALGLVWGVGSAVGSYVGSWLVLDVRTSSVIWVIYAAIAATGLMGAFLFKRQVAVST